MIQTTRKLVITGFVLAGLWICSGIIPEAAAQQIQGVHVTLTPYGGLATWSDNVNLNPKPIYGARLGLVLHPIFGIEGTYGWSPAETENGPTLWTPAGSPPPGDAVGADITHLGLDLMITPVANSMIAPYILGGVSQVRYKSDDPNEGSSDYTGFEAAGGFKIRMAPRIAMRLEARDVIFKFDNAPPAPNTDMNHNFFFTAGLQLALGGSRAVLDADRDGVNDKSDQCPNTPLGALVDVHGCPIDADKDGVPDGIDQCANTPAGAQVDARGCPADADNDGVPDGIDQCANTPAGASVDPRGCPMDADNDGVVDGLDKCPNTPTGAQVDKDGCPIEVSDRETELLDTGKITVRDIHFATAKWDILPESYKILDEIGQILVQWPELKIEIGGHADARGSDEYNLTLSQKRAQAVLDYLVQHFPQINASQYTAKGYGESQPVAPNNTVEGMARNRRVEFKVLNTEVLSKEKERRRLLKKGEE